MNRFEIRNGKFGAYFYDGYDKIDLTLDNILIYLNCLDKPKEENKLKKIDMSVCIESGIDCEFKCRIESEWFEIGKLKLIHTDGTYKTSGSINEYCRPRMNHIHACPNGFDECPLPEGFRIRAWTECNSWFQHTDQWDKDIIMFEVTEVAEGWEL